MRPLNQLVHSRTRVEQRFALLPLEGFPFSRLPTWPDAQVRVLAAPALGAGFVQYLIDLPAGKRGSFPAEDRIETFYYITQGSGTMQDGQHAKVDVRAGSFGLIPPSRGGAFVADESMQLLILRKVYEPAPAIELYESLNGHESDVKQEVWADNPDSLLQTLIPDTLSYDMAMNIFTFSPGHGLPIVETHVMEHGLLFLQGKGLYLLGDEWMEVEKDDYLWMGPYCPQSFYATGATPVKYIYYKNINREIPL
ncbi:MAG: hypothetical protein H7144_16215 [Burkholderiales bacterium]|nr:hypothetical protein [Phycisphaerae bacterium]